MVVSLIGRAGRILTKTRSRSAGTGLAGGLLVDDIPVVGDELDPTEASGGGSNQTVLLAGLALLLLVFIAVQVGDGL